MSKIRTAVIPAGGYGTRFLPATKSIPKEMFPLWNKPVILHVVEEAVASGIDNIIFVVSHHKQSVESFFGTNEVLEDYFTKIGKVEQVKALRKIENMADFSFVYTKPPAGNGAALSAARHLLVDEPFVLVWSDEIMLTNGKPRIKQCLDAFEKFGQPVISAVEIEPDERKHYGMADLKDLPGDSTVKEIIRIVEKPKPGEEPSKYATHGAYVLTPEIFKSYETVVPGKNGELWLADLINDYQKDHKLLAKIIEGGEYLDCGRPEHYLISQVEYALKYADCKEEIREILIKKLIASENTTKT